MNDLYDRLRPPDESLDDVTARRVWARVSGDTLDDDAIEPPSFIDPVRRSGAQSSHYEYRTSPRRFVGWAAVAAAVVGLGATAAVVSTRTESVAPAESARVSVAERDGDPVMSTPLDPASTTATNPGGQRAQNPSSDMLGRPGETAAGTKFAVLDNVPQGWVVASTAASADASPFGSQRWALRDATGAVTGVVSVRPPRPISNEEAAQYDDEESNAVVRGVPASEWSQSSDNGEQEQRAGITWVENLYQIDVHATGAARDLLRPVAESLVVDEQTRSVTIPDDFGLTPVAELGLADPAAVTTTISLRPSWSSGFGVSISTTPNVFGYDLDRLAGPSFDGQPIEIDGRSARAARNVDGNLAFVSWLDDDMYVTVSSTLALSDDDIVDIANAVRFTDVHEYRSFADAVTDRINTEIGEWSIFDQTTTTDGTQVSIRTRPDSQGAHALCVDAPILACETIDSEGGLVDGSETYGSKGFDLGDRRIGIAWIAASRNTQTLEPTLRASDHLNPADGFTDGTTATIIADTSTNEGRFVIVTIPDGERPPTIVFSTGNDSSPQIELTPTLDQMWPATCVVEIRNGDSPASIAAAFGVTLDRLADANSANPAWSTFDVGERINVPAPCQPAAD